MSEELSDLLQSIEKNVIHSFADRNKAQDFLKKCRETMGPYSISKNAKAKIDRVSICSFDTISKHDINMLHSALFDTWFKSQNELNPEYLSLILAREKNIDFENELADIIIGHNDKFPRRSSGSIKLSFENLGFSNYEGKDYMYDGYHENEIKNSVKNFLDELNIEEIHRVIVYLVLNKRHIEKYCDTDNIEFNEYFKNTINEYKKFINDSVNINTVSLANVMDINLNADLLFNLTANTNDSDLNSLINSAKERFWNNDRMAALRDIWDAFERIKSIYATKQGEKKTSVEKLTKDISLMFGINEEFINSEFMLLTHIGNKYHIRHKETYTIKPEPGYRDYLFFRMLANIDLCLKCMNIKDDNAEA